MEVQNLMCKMAEEVMEYVDTICSDNKARATPVADHAFEPTGNYWACEGKQQALYNCIYEEYVPRGSAVCVGAACVGRS